MPIAKKLRKCVSCPATTASPLVDNWIAFGTPDKWECPRCCDVRNGRTELLEETP